jgi:membrane protease YdiL (CAAX protease family)
MGEHIPDGNNPVLSAPPWPDPKPLPRRPRLWTVFAAFAAALGAAFGIQVVAVLGLLIWDVAQGANLQTAAQDLRSRVSELKVLFFLAALGQLAIGAVALGAAWCSRQPMRLRLGLVRAALPAWGYPVVALGALVPFGMGLGLAWLFQDYLAADQSAAEVFSQMNWGVAVPWVLFIALALAFNEELLFRGFMQRRLLERWWPGAAILVSSILFALMHIMPLTIVAVFPLGAWFGILAWRTGSVWPGIVCHAFINGSWNIYQISLRLIPLPEPSLAEVLIAIGPVGLACFGFTVYWMVRARTQDAHAPDDAPLPKMSA